MSGVCNDCHNHPCVCGMDQAGSELSGGLGVGRDDEAAERIASIIRFERSNGGNEYACANAIIRDIRWGHIRIDMDA